MNLKFSTGVPDLGLHARFHDHGDPKLGVQGLPGGSKLMSVLVGTKLQQLNLGPPEIIGMAPGVLSGQWTPQFPPPG